MLTVVLTGFSLLLGMSIAVFGSITLVIYFSAAAATIIAVLAMAVGGAVSTVLLAWFATIFAVQVGFAAATMVLAMMRSHEFSSQPPLAGQEGDAGGAGGVRDAGLHAHVRQSSNSLPAASVERSRAADH